MKFGTPVIINCIRFLCQSIDGEKIFLLEGKLVGRNKSNALVKLSRPALVRQYEIFSFPNLGSVVGYKFDGKQEYIKYNVGDILKVPADIVSKSK